MITYFNDSKQLMIHFIDFDIIMVFSFIIKTTIIRLIILFTIFINLNSDNNNNHNHHKNKYGINNVCKIIRKGHNIDDIILIHFITNLLVLIIVDIIIS